MNDGTKRGFPKPSKSTLLALAGLLLLLVLIGAQSRLSGRELDDINPETKFEYLPDIHTVRLLAPGHQGSFGRALWIRAATYFGGESIGGRQAVWMLHLCGLVVKLAPKFEWPYNVIGTSAFDDIGDLDVDLLKKGIAELPDNLHLHLFLALRMVEKHGDYQGAGEVLDRIIARTEVPEFVKGMRETYRRNENDLPQAMAIYLGEWERVKDNLQMAKPVLERLARVIHVKKNDRSSLTLQQIKDEAKLLEEQKTDARSFYVKMMSLALPEAPAPADSAGTVSSGS